MKRMACVIALATTTGIALGPSAHPALAEPTAMSANGLQIALSAPNLVMGDSSVTLDVNFRGGNVRAVELYVDGTLIKKQAIRTREGHGIISFALDATLLTEGNHEILIKAFDQSGAAATATSRLKVTPDESNALMRFLYPKKNAMVQGVVPIQVNLDKSIHNPYVMFFVDNDFLALTNFPPFTHNWDSARVSNGAHTLIVKVYDGDTTAEVQTLKMSIQVNNQGGFTARKTDIADLNTKPAAPKSNAETALPVGLLDPMEIGAGIAHNESATLKAFRLRTGNAPATMFKPVTGTALMTNAAPFATDIHRTNYAPISKTRPVLPPASLNGANTLPGSNVRTNEGQPLATDNGISHVAKSNEVRPPVRRSAPTISAIGLLSNPADLSSLSALTPKEESLAHQSVRLRRPGNIAALPASQLGATTAAPVKPQSAAVVARAPRLSGFSAMPKISLKTFQVAFDDTLIAFDVQPRVEHGLPLAPFRAIFEHTGGTVEFFNKSKTVRAYNASKEIEFRMGEKSAKVNNQPLKMEASPYIEKGRAIVPLSFVRDSLDVNVQYDPATGRLRIESKK